MRSLHLIAPRTSLRYVQSLVSCLFPLTLPPSAQESSSSSQNYDWNDALRDRAQNKRAAADDGEDNRSAKKPKTKQDTIPKTKYPFPESTGSNFKSSMSDFAANASNRPKTMFDVTQEVSRAKPDTRGTY